MYVFIHDNITEGIFMMYLLGTLLPCIYVYVYFVLLSLFVDYIIFFFLCLSLLVYVVFKVKYRPNGLRHILLCNVWD